MALKDVSCTDDSVVAQTNRFLNKILNGGCEYTDGQPSFCYTGGDPFDTSFKSQNDSLKNRCTRSQADFAFEFIAFAFCLGALALTFLSRRSSGRVSYV